MVDLRRPVGLGLRRVRNVADRWLARLDAPDPAPPAPGGGLPVWMDPVEWSQLLAILHALAPSRCLEWGSGGGTLAILDACPFIERYLSIEHDADWHASVRAKADDSRLELALVEPDRPLEATAPSEAQRITWNARAEDDRSVLASYVDRPAQTETALDFVLVDGRARIHCLRAGYDLLRPGGVIALHDAQRSQYHAALRSLGDPLFLEPWHQGQLAIVRKS